MSEKSNVKSAERGTRTLRPLVLSIDGKRRIIREVEAHTETQFEGRYKGYNVSVEWNEGMELYSIYVANPEIQFGTACDGYAGIDDDVYNLEDAIKYALRGACLI